ncbi:hypothetical protein HY495_03140 [Candidatus Woesearchaeota archaeon]|nr:hypothetical protein [Candidatus Woesearchaeota archaeon]
MGKHVSEATAQRIEDLLFDGFGQSPGEVFFRKELQRYVPEMRGLSDDEVRTFAQYQKAVYLQGKVPEIGRELACLNPTFIDDLENIVFEHDGRPIWTMASKKENGYRIQLHIGPQENTIIPNISAFTRQFTTYDLRLFPELLELLAALPVMIGDGELISARHEHLAGFNRVQTRIPNATYWPRRGELGLSAEFVQKYGESDLFVDGKPRPDLELTISFHSLFAIADPATWTRSREEQVRSLRSVSTIPKDYRLVDELLDQLDSFMQERGLSGRIVERTKIVSPDELQRYVADAERKGLEGICVSQCADPASEDAIRFAKTYKIKNYETVDAVLLGLYLQRPEEGISSDNLKGALLGLYDETLRQYLPAFKVNLDSSGVQIKTSGQRERLDALREEIVQAVEQKKALAQERNIVRLHDVFVAYGGMLLAEVGVTYDLEMLFTDIPRGMTFTALVDYYAEHQDEFLQHHDRGKKKLKTKRDAYFQQHREFFVKLQELEPDARERVADYFALEHDVHKKSQMLPLPQIGIRTDDPIILEGRVFDVKYKLNPCPAGFRADSVDSLHLSNAFAERVRYDKTTTTDIETIERIARNNTA